MTLFARFERVRAWLRERPAVPVFTFILAAHLGRFLIWIPRDYYSGGDGYYIYMLARSMAYDFDIDLTNDYAICGDPWAVGKDFGTGHPANPWYIGPATVWAPALYVLRHLIPVAADATPQIANGCRGPVVWALGLLAPFFVLLTVYCGYRIATRFVRPGSGLLAALIVAFGSPLIVFGPLWWNYSHVWAAGALTLACLAFVRTAEAPERTRLWFATGAAVGWAALMRPHHALWVLAPGLLTCVEAWKVARTRRVPWRECGRGLVTLLGFFTVFSIRLASHQYMYGSPWPPVFRAVYLQPAHAHPLLMLFSARAGLFAYSPMMWLALFGFVGSLFWRKHARVLAPISAAFLLDFWICSSPLEWTAGATVGPRLLASFCGLFVVWTAFAVDAIATWANATPMRLQRFAALGWLGLPLLLAWQLTWGEGPYDAPSIYGRATRTLVEELNEHIGNPMTFPAPLVFRARYHAPAKEFDRVANYGLFFHDFERGRLLGGDRLVFAHPQSEVLMLEGLAEIPQGRRIRRHRPGRLIYPLAWPYVTSVVVELAQPPRQAGCRIELENALFFQHRRMRSRAIALDQVSIEIPAPTGAFDSGLNETRIRSNCTLDLTVLRFVDTSGESDSTMLPHYENDPRFR